MVRSIARRLEARLGEVYLVGGAVRDVLMGIEPGDLDFATPLPPQEVAKRLAEEGFSLNLKGIKYGTVAFFVDGVSVEVTTFRRDTDYDGRRPVVVYGASLLEDLSRRDFTVNAMAMDPRGKLLDPFSGREDLERGILRAVGNPWERFREDRIRVVRAARFAAHLGASIEEATWEAALQMGPRVLEAASLPRMGDEFTKGLIEGRGRFVLLAQEMGFLYKLFPELVGPYGPARLLRQNPQHHPEGDVLSHLAQLVPLPRSRSRGRRDDSRHCPTFGLFP